MNSASAMKRLKEDYRKSATTQRHDKEKVYRILHLWQSWVIMKLAFSWMVQEQMQFIMKALFSLWNTVLPACCVCVVGSHKLNLRD